MTSSFWVEHEPHLRSPCGTAPETNETIRRSDVNIPDGEDNREMVEVTRLETRWREVPSSPVAERAMVEWKKTRGMIY
jgi:hypothetical protein